MTCPFRVRLRRRDALRHPDPVAGSTRRCRERLRDAVERSGDVGADGTARRQQTISVGVAMVAPMLNRTPGGSNGCNIDRRSMVAPMPRLSFQSLQQPLVEFHGILNLRRMA